VHEHDWLALPFVEKGYFDPVMRDPRHGRPYDPADQMKNAIWKANPEKLAVKAW
jgi:hypothetical protein